MAYTEGKLDDPVDTQDRLARVGAKYQATAPAVADGDNVYFLVDAAGRPLIAGAVASDAPAAGNPVQMGGVVDDTSPAAAAEADARAFRATPEGNQIVELYKDNNALSPIAAMPGASEVKRAYKGSVSDSTTRVTIFTPTSGKKIRIISIDISTLTPTAALVEIYLGTAASAGTDDTKHITQPYLDLDLDGHAFRSWPDGGGPIGAVDEVLSLRTDTNVTTSVRVQITYREE